MHIDTFSSSISDLKASDRSPENALKCLIQNPRVSTWDMIEKPWVRGLIDKLKLDGVIIEDKSEQYPWHRYNVIGQHAKEPNK